MSTGKSRDRGRGGRGGGGGGRRDFGRDRRAGGSRKSNLSNQVIVLGFENNILFQVRVVVSEETEMAAVVEAETVRVADLRIMVAIVVVVAPPQGADPGPRTPVTGLTRESDKASRHRK